MGKVLHRLSPYLVILFFAMAILPRTVSADLGDSEDLDVWADVSEDIGGAPGYEDPKDSKRDWSLSLGFASGVSPEYEGSDRYSFGIGPNFAGSWRKTLFFKGKILGANIIRQNGLKAGPILVKSSGRDEDDDDKLKGLGDVDSSTEVDGFVSYRTKPWRFRVEARKDVGSGHGGALVELTGGTTLPFWLQSCAGGISLTG